MKLISQLINQALCKVPTNQLLKEFPEIDSTHFLLDLTGTKGGLYFYLFANAFRRLEGEKLPLVLANRDGDVIEIEFDAEKFTVEKEELWEKKDIGSLNLEFDVIKKIVIETLRLKPVATTKLILSNTPPNFIQIGSSLIIDDYDAIDEDLTLLMSLLSLLYKWDAAAIDTANIQGKSHIVIQPGKLSEPSLNTENILERISLNIHSMDESLKKITTWIDRNS